MIHQLVAALALASPSWADPSVCIDPGHGGSDPGAVANGMYESDLNLEAGLAFRDWLELDSSDGGGGGSWEVHVTRETDVEVSLSSRCDYANSLGVDYFMSIHANAGGGDGTETYAYSSGTEADQLAHKVQEEVLDHLGTRDRGVKYESFYVLVNTNMPADLNEMAFMDTWSGNAELLSEPANLDAVGLAHLHAIQRHTGLSAYTPSDDPDPGEPTGRVWFADYPVGVYPEQEFTVTVGYQTDLHEFGERGELGLRMVDADSWETLQELSWDNGGTGIQGPEGEHDFALAGPDGVDEVLFVTWLAPLGDSWDERYDDANTGSTPTEVLEDGPVDTGEPPDPGEIAFVSAPGFVVHGQRFELRVRHGEGVWAAGGLLGVEVVELPRGVVVDSLELEVSEDGVGVESFEFLYSGQAEKIWFHACAFEHDGQLGGACLAEDDTESGPTRVMQGREEFGDGGCAGCASGGRQGGLCLLLGGMVLGLARARRGRTPREAA